VQQMTLKELLKQKKVSQEKLVRYFLTNDHYKWQQQVSSWITGKRLPDVTSIFYIAKLLGCSTDEVINSLHISEAAD